jgi:hypothetical protein
VFKMKLVELEILKNSYFGNFSSHYMILGVLWQKLIKGSCVLGVLQYTDESTLGSGRHGRRRAAVAFHSLLVYPSWPARNRARLPTAASSSLAIYISKPHNRRRFSLFFSLFLPPPLSSAAHCCRH